jgi:hypothetical protein
MEQEHLQKEVWATSVICSQMWGHVKNHPLDIYFIYLVNKEVYICLRHAA